MKVSTIRQIWASAGTALSRQVRTGSTLFGEQSWCPCSGRRSSPPRVRARRGRARPAARGRPRLGGHIWARGRPAADEMYARMASGAPGRRHRCDRERMQGDVGRHPHPGLGSATLIAVARPIEAHPDQPDSAPAPLLRFLRDHHARHHTQRCGHRRRGWSDPIEDHQGHSTTTRAHQERSRPKPEHHR